MWLTRPQQLDYDHLILGSSAAYNGVDTAWLNARYGTNALDLSSRGASYAELYLTLDLYLSQHRCRRIILQVDTWGLSDDSYSYPFHDYLYMPYLANEVVYRHVAEYCGATRTALWRWVPMLKYGEFNVHYGPKMVWDSFIRTEPFTVNAKELPARCMSEAAVKKVRARSPVHYAISSSRTKYFSRLLDLAEQRGVEVIMFLAPEYSERSRLIVNRDEIVAYYARQANARGIPLFVCQNQALLDDPSYFFDSNHLCRKGARVFTEQLGAFLREHDESTRTSAGKRRAGLAVVD